MIQEKLETFQTYAERLASDIREPGFLKEQRALFIQIWTLITGIPLPAGMSSARLPGGKAMRAMPLAGGLFAFIAILPALLLSFFIPPLPCAWIACGIYTIAGWSLHLDGWGDLWDGIGSGRKGEAMRAVMKDSHTGSFAVAGLVLAVSIRASLLASIDTSDWAAACIIAGGVGRFCAVVTAYFGEYPWGAGMTQDFVREADGYQLFCAFVASCLLFPFAAGGWFFGMIFVCFAGRFLAQWANKNLGGTNGDVLGAASVLGEILVLISCAAF